MSLSGKLSDLKLLIALFGNIPVKDIIQFRKLNNIPNKWAYNRINRRTQTWVA